MEEGDELDRIQNQLSSLMTKHSDLSTKVRSLSVKHAESPAPSPVRDDVQHTSRDND